jgi:glycosyltransferase involved in cell wall biosynthesis
LSVSDAATKASARLPRRVLHVMNGAAGGAALSTLGLIAEFRKAGVESSIVCHDSGSARERDALRAAVDDRIVFRPLYWWNRKTRAPAWRRPLIELRQQLRTGCRRRSTNDVIAAARRFGAELIHTNTLLTPEGGLAAKRLGLPHVWHVRELVGPGNPYRFAGEGPAFGNVVADLATVVVANSRTTAATIAPWLPANVLRVVSNGIDVGVFEQHVEPADGRPLVVAMAANLSSAWKKQDVFLEAAARVSGSYRVEFRIYGHMPSTSGICDDWQRRIDALNLSGRFHLSGHVADPVELMKQVDVLVHTADHESFGRAVVEAMAAGIPVVGVNGGGVAEIVVDGETGLLAPPDDSRALGALIERLLADPALRRRLGANGRTRARQEYDLSRCARQMLDVYRSAMTTGATVDA